MSVDPFNTLVMLTARAFYDDVTAKGDNHQPKNARSDNRGIAVVVLDALTRCQWVREEDLAKALHLNLKQLRRTLQILKDEKLVANDQQKETAKGAKLSGAAAAGTSDGQRTVKGGEDKMKTRTHSYWCLDYAQIYDVVRYRIHRMKKDLKDKLDNSNTVQRYMCPRCGKRYSAFDALLLGSQNDEYFQCENCNGEVVPESDKSAYEEMADGDNTKKQKREKLNNMFQKLEEQLKPLTLQLAMLKDLTVPEFETLQEWEARANVAAIVNDPSQAQGYGLSMPLLGDTRVEVALIGGEVKEEETGTDAKTPNLKVLPPWMIKQGMNLTKEQRGEMEQNSASVGDKKTEVEIEDKKSIEYEYVKAYYAAVLKRQEQEEASKRVKQEGERDEASISGLANDVSEAPSQRKVGEKSNWVEDGDDDVEWEAEPLPVLASPMMKRQEQEEASKRVKQEGERHEASISGLDNDVSEVPSERKVGEKSKWEEDGDDDVEWETEPLPILASPMMKRQEQEEASKRVKQEGEWDEASISGLANDVSEAPSQRKVGEKSKWVEDGDDDVEWEAEPLPVRIF